MIRSDLNHAANKRALIHELIDFAAKKVTMYRDIAPRAETLKKLRNGKMHKEKKRSRHVSEARVLIDKVVNERLSKLAEAEVESARRQKVAEEKKKLAEEKKATREGLDIQWKADLQ